MYIYVLSTNYFALVWRTSAGVRLLRLYYENFERSLFMLLSLVVL